MPAPIDGGNSSAAPRITDFVRRNFPARRGTDGILSNPSIPAAKERIVKKLILKVLGAFLAKYVAKKMRNRRF